jgi:hypothetical protein
MKKQLINSIEKKVFTFLVAFVFFFGSYAKIYASPKYPMSKDSAPYFTYTGLRDNFLVFKVDYKNELVQPFKLVIKNEVNEVLYQKMFDAIPLNTNVLLTEVPDDSKLTFSIVTINNNFSKSFEIDTKVKTTEEYIVKGL